MNNEPESKNVDALYPTKSVSGVDENQHPIFKAEKRILVLSKNDPVGKKVYDKFYQDLGTYILKLPNSPSKDAVDMAFQRGIIYLGRNSSGTRTGVIGTVVIHSGKLAGIVVDVTELDIDTRTGETSNIDMCFYATYFELIRAAVIHSEKSIMNDEKLHRMVTKYLMFLLLRLVGTGVNLTDKQKIFLEAITKYFYYRFMLMYRHPQARELTLIGFDKAISKEIDHFMPNLEKYMTMRDVFKAMVDYGITNEPPSVMIMKALSKFKTFVFYAFTSSLDYLVALAVVSKYPVSFLSGAHINSDIQTELENQLTKYFRSVTYDVTALSKF